MKKLLAMLLALMLLVVSAACAETANVITFNNATISTTTGGQTQNIELTDLSATLAAGLPGEVPTIQLDVANGSEALLGAIMQIVDGKAVIEIDEVSKALAADLSAMGVEGEDIIKAAFANLDQLSTVKLPRFTGVDIPKIDLISLSALIGAEPATDESGAQVATFEVPYELIKQLLSMVGQYRSAVPEAAQATVGQLFDLIDQMVASDSGFALSGKITDDGTTSGLVLDIYPVSAGATADAAVAALVVSSSDNQLNVGVDIYSDGQSMNVAEFALTSKPAEAELSFSLDVMGMISVTGSLYTEDDAQVFALQFSAGDQVISLSVVYGETEGNDYVTFAFEAPNVFAINFSVTDAVAEDGSINGSVSLTMDTYTDEETHVTFDADYVNYVGDVEFRSVSDAANALDVASLSEEETAQLQEELNNALGKLVGYLNTLQPAA